ncbi:FHA domain-containing serine/threonine-protein kinase [Paludisphaera rhizosphaerae]|uniref:FHA domain-containing serine/threonine-protein kinase n=1 Tax=Paludisphaera rhizosphaerae TaxID=2711216 RepID=UPI002106D4A6|nr:FHA domain-containing serine/threonine-protein kinase [Paludisphaera rhizosphaerae]
MTLRVLDGPHAGESFTFHGHDTFVVGRSRKSSFRLPEADMTLSRFQFLIEVNPPICRLVDMASTNGTRVNGRRVDVAELDDGDVVRGGRTSFGVSINRGGNSSFIPLPPHSDAAPASPTQDEFPAVPGFRLERLLGEGATGAVYLGRDVLGEAAAVKLISPAALGAPGAVARFLREATILRRLEHPGIVGYRAIGKAGSQLYFAMEYVDGSDATSLVDRQGPLNPREAVRLMTPILDALTYAHSVGFVHRDVKPSNVLVGWCHGEEVVKLADFGLSRIYQESTLCGLTMTGCGGGTTGFTPPEQVVDLRSAGTHSDQYAAAATLYYLLTGTTIHDYPATIQGRLRKILNEDAVPLRSRREDAPVALASVVDRALSREPTDRYPSVTAFREALVEHCGDG